MPLCDQDQRARGVRMVGVLRGELRKGGVAGGCLAKARERPAAPICRERGIPPRVSNRKLVRLQRARTLPGRGQEVTKAPQGGCRRVTSRHSRLEDADRVVELSQLP